MEKETFVLSMTIAEGRKDQCQLGHIRLKIVEKGPLVCQLAQPPYLSNTVIKCTN